MKPVLTIFIDGLKPESLPHMPFLNSLPHQRRLETILGYSITCHASMYTGVYPNKHKLWFLWQYSPATSPFRWLKKLPFLYPFNIIPAWLFLRKITLRYSKLTSYWKIPRILNLPLRYWPNIDVAEKKYWDEDGYVEGYPTIFEKLREHGVPYEIVGMVPGTIHTSRIIAEHAFDEIKPWTYLFVGDLDAISHHHGQDAPEVIEKLKELDAILERCYRDFEARVGDFDCFVFSDHGHARLNEKIDLYQVFREAGDNLNRYMHLMDANVARFWFRNEKERARVEKILSTLENGYVLSPEKMAHYHMDMPDTRYGELLYYLDLGSAFSRTIFGYGFRQQSIHGYVPDHPEVDGVFVSNRPIAGNGKVRLVDILPSLLSQFGLPIPGHVDGKSIWE
ncbi:MAG: alkaline phosphatase family protein [Chloroflexota bacterium]